MRYAGDHAGSRWRITPLPPPAFAGASSSGTLSLRVRGKNVGWVGSTNPAFRDVETSWVDEANPAYGPAPMIKKIPARKGNTILAHEKKRAQQSMLVVKGHSESILSDASHLFLHFSRSRTALVNSFRHISEITNAPHALRHKEKIARATEVIPQPFVRRLFV